MSEYIDLGRALNHLLNCRTLLGRTKGGLELPIPGERNGTMSVVVITGSPGSGKSTLALQMVTRAAERGHDSLYLSLEDYPKDIKRKASFFGRSPQKDDTDNNPSWDNFIHVPDQPPQAGEKGEQAEQRIAHVIQQAREKIADQLRDYPVYMTTHGDKIKVPHNLGAVVAASLLPRPVDVSPERAKEFFLQQYQYLEMLVKGAATNAKTLIHDIPELTSFGNKLKHHAKGDHVSAYIYNQLDPRTRKLLASNVSDTNDDLKTALLKDLACIVKSEHNKFHKLPCFKTLASLPAIANLLKADLSDIEITRLNLRLLLEAYPKEILINLSGIRMVVIDSLNMLSYSGQSRESLFRVFDLFRANGIMGIFTVDGDSSIPFDSTMSDVVFSFSQEKDSAYLVRYLSLEKSRYTATAFGLHPYKITDTDGIYVLPSLHAVVAATQEPEHKDTPEKTASFDKKTKRPFSVDKKPIPFGWGDELTAYVVRSTCRPAVVALHGPNSTRKSTIAANFLIHGLVGNKEASVNAKKESGILIRLKDAGETADFSTLQSYESMNYLMQQKLAPCDPSDMNVDLLSKLRGYERGNKAVIKVWGIDGKANEEVIVVVNFNTGMLLPEEFVDIVTGVYATLNDDNKYVCRVVLDDVSVIGAGSYPLLEESQTTADLFLAAFVHVMRNKKIDLMLVGTRSRLDSGNESVDRAIALADTVIETKIRDIFGNRYVLLVGDGDMAGDPLHEEWVPPALQILPRKEAGATSKKMVFDRKLLRGLTGFDGPEITRTKVYAYLYEENKEIHRRYNETLPYLVEALCGLPSSKGDSGLQIISFKPHISDTVHSSVDLTHIITGGAPPPKQHTVLAMIDEFEPPQRDASGKEVESRAYTNNVLFVAWRSDLIRPKMSKRDPTRPWNTWQEMLNTVESANINPSKLLARVWVDRVARETLSCCLADCLVSGWKKTRGTKCQNLSKTWEEILDTLKIRGEGKMISNLVSEVTAMHRLLRLAQASKTWSVQSRPLVWDNLEIQPANSENERRELELRDGLPDDATLYICWYAQLRHLLARNTELAGKFRVAALPGGGFKGDWRLGVLQGSVSKLLGNDVVRALTSPEEDYRRYSLGVGLPVGANDKGKNWQESEFRAWPGADKRVSMKNVYKIHGAALKRSSIRDYVKITPSLATFAKRLAGDWMEKKEPSMNEPKIKKYVERLPAHFDVLRQAIR